MKAAFALAPERSLCASRFPGILQQAGAWPTVKRLGLQRLIRTQETRPGRGKGVVKGSNHGMRPFWGGKSLCCVHSFTYASIHIYHLASPSHSVDGGSAGVTNRGSKKADCPSEGDMLLGGE